ncbi:crotonobetaine/carnitine-CoA ligase [Atlantibacter subterranea]|uniref:crotonobetaine/carnitine-CoA ligase n=1 Tax=Atlantibacter subterraneus TaxID=255519 RepID=UPI0020C5985F|nr:crotonobetaine/carnitine-CoA ligase [Atlantibacter subterranea]UTJ48086.1 crotonobetaine/carnitine-CoA ligase [Atlantibacter subterranea]
MDIIGEQNLRQMWEDLAITFGEKTALVVESCQGKITQLSYAALNNEINRTANLFTTLGIAKGNKVALHLDNCAEFIFCWFGLAKIGAIMVPINARLLTDECSWLLNNCQARLVVTSLSFYRMYQQIKTSRQTMLERICLIAEEVYDSDEDTIDFHRLRGRQPTTLIDTTPLIPLDTAEILFTSGTTSRPKGVVITHYNLRYAGYYSSWQCALREDDVYLTSMPAFHIDCQCTAAMAAFSVGATLVLLEKYSARAFWKQIRRYRATVTECIPMMIRTLMLQPPEPQERQHCLREILFYLHLSVAEKDAFIERFHVRLLTSYGMTETIVGVIGDRPGDKRCWPSIGRVGFGYQIEIRNSQNQQVPYGETGEICVKGEPGKTLFKEYYNHPDATVRIYDSHGWLHTGDFGYVTEDGFFYFIDRSCNMIKRGGENISCTEIENIIARHPKIQDVAVIGVNDPLRDWALKAFVVVNEGEQLNENEFFLFCENTMAKFKVPAFVEFCGDLPRNCTGKIIRKYLQ